MHATHLLYALSIVVIEAKQNCNSNSQLAISIVIIEVRIHICVCYWTVYKLQQLVGKLERKAVHVNQASCGQKRNLSTTSFQVLSLSKTLQIQGHGEDHLCRTKNNISQRSSNHRWCTSLSLWFETKEEPCAQQSESSSIHVQENNCFLFNSDMQILCFC